MDRPESLIQTDLLLKLSSERPTTRPRNRLWQRTSELEQSLNLLERLGGIIEMGQRMAKDQGHE
jgi:hypothetical protein